jgi:ABC-type glycerol-3-phosphate transport system substrate-binding protein
VRRLALALLLLLGACGGGAAEPETQAQAQPISFTAPAVGGGNEVDASRYAGRDVVLWFWSPW